MVVWLARNGPEYLSFFSRQDEMIRYDHYLLVPIYLLSTGFCLVRFYILRTQISSLAGEARAPFQRLILPNIYGSKF